MGLTLQDPSDFDIAPDGKIYVLDLFNVKVFSPKGELLKELYLDDTYAGSGIATDNQGHFFVSRPNNQVCKYTVEGKLVMCFGSAGKAPGQFVSHGGIDLDAEGNIYVADAGNYRVQKFDSKGKILKVYDKLEIGPEAYMEPYKIKIDANNDLNIVGVHWYKRIKQNGTPDLLINGGFIQDMAFDAEKNIYLTAVPLNEGQYITKYSYTGDTLATYLNEGTEEGNLSGLYTALSTDPEHNLWVMEYTPRSLKGRIHKLSPTFEFTLTFGDAGDDNKSKVNMNFSLRFDNNGNYYSYHDGKLNLYDNSGNHVGKLRGKGGSDYDLFSIKDMAFDSQEAVYVLAESSDGLVHKFAPTGEFTSILLKQPLLPEGGHFSPNRILLDRADNLYLIGQNRCLKYNLSGELIGDFAFEFQTGLNGSLYPIHDLRMDALGFFYAIQDQHVTKYNQVGKVITKFEVLAPGRHYEAGRARLDIDDYGFIYVADRLAVRKYSASGNLIASIPDKYHLTGNPIIPDFRVNKDGSKIWTAVKDFGHFNNILIYQNKNAVNTPLPNLITGSIYNDSNADCVQDKEEAGMGGMIVMATPGPYYSKTNSYGQFSLQVPPGVYTVNQILQDQNGKRMHQICPQPADGQIVDLSQKAGAKTTVNFGNRVTLSPHLAVSVSSNRRRRCFESTTTVKYSNTGFAIAPDAKVYLQLPGEVELLSADKPYTLLKDGTYEFSVGDLAAGQHGTITIQDLVTCGDESVRGRTVCTRAWITPSNNKPAEPTPTISITGRCHAELGMIRFVVRNTGTADMDQYELFRKYANGELASQEQFRLAAGDSLVLWVPSLGYTWRLEADQPTGNGDNTTASVTIEGCPSEAASSVSTGMVNLLPTDDEEAEKSEECMPITDSYDPNDKLVTPVGRTGEFYTPTGSELKYKIRFQNTGTDVAYRIVVVDTLSEHLDLSTLQLGATSHPSRVEVSGKGRPVLTWTFDNIMLPDSTADEPGSHGYILFSIKPKADLPVKTLVENFADIFFDFNSPIRTNITQNRIYNMPPVVNEAVRVHLEDVLATPGIAGFFPSAGKFGSEVTITGQRFATVPGNNKVYLNGKPATVVSATATELKVLVPTGAATGNLKVITPDGGVTSADRFQVYQPPVLASFSPAEGMVGQTVTITGEHLQSDMIETVKLGELTCEIVSSSANMVTVRVPAEATTGAFRISTKGGETLSSTAYTVWYAPGITALSRQRDIMGASVTITGENFAADKTRNKVRFGRAMAEVLEASPRQMTVRVPEGAESGFISVETPGGKATTATRFEVIPGPRFKAMQPASGTVGTVVEITGEHFGIMGQQDVIRFNGKEALVLESAGDRYRVRVPRGTTTGKVTITGFGGQAQSSADFVVEELAPAEAISVYPNPNSGQFTVSLRHADFDVQQMEVYDALGKRLHQTHITGPRPEAVEISLPTAKAGLYFLQIQTERGTITKKLTVL